MDSISVCRSVVGVTVCAGVLYVLVSTVGVVHMYSTACVWILGVGDV